MQLYFSQLEKHFPAYLRNVIMCEPFVPVVLRGGKNKPATTVELHQQVQIFQKHEKNNDQPGWVIQWGSWTSKKFGSQQWPEKITVETETDLIYLLHKEKEVQQFKTQLLQLLQWKPALQSWLSERPNYILNFLESWAGIISVVDYLLQHPVKDHYKRSIPVPVHTKFMEQHEPVILSLLQHLDPDRLTPGADKLEKALGLRTKPHLFPIRWLDLSLTVQYTHGMEVLGITTDNLKKANWAVQEIWLVENETNLYLLPERKQSLAIFGKGYALELLADIPLLHNHRIIYWGDLDEDGFKMLSRLRQLYPHTISALMDEATVNFHHQEITPQPKKYSRQPPANLTDSEKAAFNLLHEVNGRIEQEKLNQLYIQERIFQL